MSRCLSFGRFRVLDTSKTAFARLLRRRLSRRQPTTVFFANSNFVVRCAHLIEAIDQAGILLVNDGLAMDVAARMRHGRRFCDNLNGTDFTPFLLRRLPALRLALAGSSAESVAGAAESFAAFPHIQIVDIRDGFSGIRSPSAIAGINAARPDVLLVAMGNPVQEEWILRNRNRLNVPLVLAVGALFDFAAGRVVRAPVLIQRARLEWAFRLCQEPRRLLKRYTVDTALFFLTVLSSPRY